MADEKGKAQKPKKEPKGERQGKKGAGGARPPRRHAAAAAAAEAKPREPEVKVPARLQLALRAGDRADPDARTED